MVNAVCCVKEERPDIHIDKDKPCPKFIPFRCTHGGPNGGKCQNCGIEKKLNILNSLRDLSTDNDEDKVEVKVWKDMPRQGTNSKGEQNTQRELADERWTIERLVDEFKMMLEVCVKHCQEIRWIRHIQQTDFTRLPPNTLLIFTDFAASMALRAAEAKNSSVNAHAVNDNFVVVYNKRTVKLKERKKRKHIEVLNEDEQEDLTIWTCDVHHFFAESMSKGKKNDHAMHNTSLDAVIKKYAEVFETLGNKLEVVIVWSDNAPTQYRCRQNFIQVASVEERHPGIVIIHRTAVVDQFKGNHDAVGKDAAVLVRSLELAGIRSPNAEMVFVNCHRLETRHEESEWHDYEIRGDVALKRKGIYGMNSRTVHFVVESQEEFDRLNPLYPGKILLCDRSYTLDTHAKKPVPNTTQLHEVRSVATAVPTELPRVWPMIVSFLPCNCKYCIDGEVYFPLNQQCKMIQWRKCTTHNARTNGLLHAAAESLAGEGLAVKGSNGQKCAKQGTYLFKDNIFRMVR
eukprot:scaffold68305_cov22-Cyclotella_meneghiniana.AAC.1